MPAALAAASPSYTDTAAALRRAVGLGMAGMALTAHVVLDAAAEARVHGMHQAVQLEVYE